SGSADAFSGASERGSPLGAEPGVGAAEARGSVRTEATRTIAYPAAGTTESSRLGPLPKVDHRVLAGPIPQSHDRGISLQDNRSAAGLSCLHGAAADRWESGRSGMEGSAGRAAPR